MGQRLPRYRPTDRRSYRRRGRPSLRAPLFWSIVDDAIRGLEARLHELARTGATSGAALPEIAAAFEATAARTRDPEITLRARKLAARP